MKRVVRILALLAILPLVGMTGFVWIEGWSYFDALYMAVITLSTVGFHEMHPLSTGGRVFVIGYLVVGLGVFFYGIVQIGEFVVRAELHSWLGRRRMDTALKSAKDHFIICGAGRVGRSVCRQLAKKKVPFVVIDRDDQVLTACRDEGWVGIVGDATDDDTLIDAGLRRARGLAAVLSSDADNLYVVLSARLLSPSLQVISRADDERSRSKMEKAGADRVISLYRTGAVKMAEFLVKPDLEDFFEIFTSRGGEVDLAEIRVRQGSPFSGKTLQEAEFGRQGVVIVGIRKTSGELVMPPAASTPIQIGDELIALGKADAIAQITGA